MPSDLLYGHDGVEGLVAVEVVEKRFPGSAVELFFRRGEETVRESAAFEPYLWAAEPVLRDCPVPFRRRDLAGSAALNVLARFATWRDAHKARSWLARATGFSPSAPNAPYLFLTDAVQQYLTLSGRVLFRGLPFDSLRRMQVDIECATTDGYEFCNPEREGDRILAIAVGDSTGRIEVLSGAERSEKELLTRFVEIVSDRDPDVIEGHNIFNFDLPYLTERAARLGVRLGIGRDGSVPRRRASRLSVGERTISYERFDVFGRHVVDTLFLVHAYDIAHRSLDGFGLKQVAAHFGISPPNRRYLDPSRITSEFRAHPDRVLEYVRDDVIETRELSRLLSPSGFIQAGMLPMSYQNTAVRGHATKIDALMIRAYLQRETALPVPSLSRGFAGGYTDVFVEGIVENVHHCDVRSLYPSLMLVHRIAPRSDELGVFLKLLDALRTLRIDAKRRLRENPKPAAANALDALQGAFKILINSFYGYLGFQQGRFNDFDAAERVTELGRSLLQDMIGWLTRHGARPVEMDTDGIYFVPPAEPARGLDSFRRAFAASLPEGIEIEFDGEYRSMYSYKMKNYALLGQDGEMILKGAALKSRGLEPFQRDFLRKLIRLKLEGRASEIAALRDAFARAIREREWPVERLAKTETLQDSPSTYTAKVGKGNRGRNAAYELALRSEREYRAGDQLSYYVTGDRKSVAVYRHARLVGEWDPKHRDENVAYYLAKLDALYKKFAGEDAQGELEL